MSIRYAAALAAALVACAAHAQSYPLRPVRLIVPFAPGGGTDIVARVVAQKAGELLKQTVVVDNRGGAGGLIGTEMAVRAAPDGYTLGVVTASLPISAATSRLSYDPVRDFTLISMLGETGYLITVHPALPVKTTKELIAYARANPGKVTYGSSGTGGTAHLSGELFDLLAGVKTTHVPYKSTGPALTDLLAGQISMIYGSLPVVVPQMNSGKLRVVSITTAKRSRALPGVPTIAESGVPGYDALTWYGLVGPRGLVRDAAARWQGVVSEAMRSKEIKDRFDADGLDFPELGPAYFGSVLRRDVDKWAKVVKAANIRLSQ
ncbi:MAG TPA: tripartite tricarboxylate transporter substrate binding protein [Burkholderiales bacterium]|nr:tripartite tricarboxylate transporter substrate binding protein [Burkholderiales bacterium]